LTPTIKNGIRASSLLVLVFILLLGVAGCGTGNNVETQSLAKKLFDRGTEQFGAQHYAEAVTLFETLINSYPDSEYGGRANLVLNDCDRITACASVHAQGVRGYPGGAQTFFPNMPEEGARPGKKRSARHQSH
jgi:hypothetical protein